MNVIVLFVVLLILLVIGVPVGFAIGGATIVALYYFTNIDMIITAQYCFSGINSFTLLAIPFFMLAGMVMSRGGIARRIVNFCDSLVGFLTGGLGAVTILAATFFAALSGSGMATTSAIGSMMIPEMSNKGYKRAYASTLVCFGAIVGPIIPPSISFVLYGTTANVSISDLFLAGVLPGILISLLLIVTNYLMCKKQHMGEKEVQVEQLPIKEVLKRRGKRLWKATTDGFFALLSPVIILGGIYSGIFTPTEAACVSVVYSVIVSRFIYRETTWKQMYRTFLEAAILNGITSFLLSYSTVFSSYLSYANIPDMIADVLSVCGNKFVLLLVINLILLVLGCFLDTVPAVIIMTPILLPAVLKFGVDPIHFGVILAVNLAIGLCTPPYGCNLFVGAAVGKIKMQEMFPYLFPMLATVIVALLLITFIPQISLLFI